MLFDPATADFQLEFNVNTGIQQPTIIYINEDLNYPYGNNIQVSPSDSLTWKSSSRNYYEFSTTASTRNGTTVGIKITQKPSNWFYRGFIWLKKKINYWKKRLIHK